MNNKIITLAGAMALMFAAPFALATPPDDPGSNQPSTVRHTDSMTPSATRPTDQNGEVYQPGSSGTDSQTGSTDRQNNAFTLLDRNNDGMLNRDELQGDAKATGEFDELDADGDAKISTQEWAMYDSNDTTIRPQ